MSVYAKRLGLLLFILLLGVAPVACGQPSDIGEPQSPELMIGVDTCDECGMLISEARSASALLLMSGDYLLFDDIGEMVVYHMDHPDDMVRAWFVHDANDETWIRGETAFYIITDQAHTPMGSGVLAYATEEAAAEAASLLKSKVFDFEYMRAEVHMTFHN